MIFRRHYSASYVDKGTLYADRNLINRRNVTADVKSNRANNKAFTLLEIKARIIAATLVVLGMNDISGEPTKHKVTDGLRNGDAFLRQIYLYKIAKLVLSEFVIDKDSLQKLVDNILSEQEQHDLANSQQLTADGRFPCRSPGCEKTFRYDGSSRRKHEQTHHPPPVVPESPRYSQHEPRKSPPESTDKADDAFSYNCSLLHHGLLFMNFLDATSEGDGGRLLRCWKFLLLHFKEEKATETKYALEALYLIFQTNLLPPDQAHKLIWNRTVNNKGGPGRNVALDLDLEHENNYLKQAIKNLGANVTPEAVLRISKSQKVTRQILSNLDDECSVKRKSGKHVSSDYSKDLKTVVKALMEEEVFVFHPGRQYVCFQNFQRDPLSRLDTSKLFKWIDYHKKNIAVGRKAR